MGEKLGVLIKTTLVDFPGIVASSFFFRGCNLLCPYCYNAGLVLNADEKKLNGCKEETFENDEFVSKDELFLHLEKRKNVIKGLVLSGGEALMSPLLCEILEFAKKLGLKTKLDTNGTLPEKLQKIIENPLTHPDFIAVDVKTSPEKYSKLCGEKNNYATFENLNQKLLESIKIISSNYLPENYEVRTVLVPRLVTENDIKNIAKILPKDATWKFQAFQAGNCISDEYNKIEPYTYEEMQELVALAKSYLSKADLR